MTLRRLSRRSSKRATHVVANSSGPYLEVNQHVESKRAVVAVDFGSTHSGYAYSLRPENTGDPYDVIIPLVKGKYYKQPTSVLMDKETESLLHFGYAAREEYKRRLEQDDNVAGMLYFNGSNVKMRLWNNGGLQENLTCETVDGRAKLPLMTVITAVLRWLKVDALKQLAQGTDLQIAASEVLWVVTVPAIWMEPDKQFMRKAAFGAGMILEPASADLVLALEPECATIAMHRDDANPLPLKEGDKVLTLDCGGGTCDVGCVEVLSCSDDFMSLRQLLEPSGGNWGAVNVDWNFFRFLGDLLGDPELKYIRSQHPLAIMELVATWNTFKVTLKAEDFGDQATKKPLNMGPILHLFDDSLDVFVERYNESVDDDMQLSFKGRRKHATMLMLPPALLLSFFDPVITLILGHVDDLMRAPEAKGLNYLVLVGGFGECSLLQQRLREMLDGKKTTGMKVFIPNRITSAVVTGAVKYGLQPAIIETRRSRMTIGVKATMPLSRAPDPKNKAHRSHRFFNEATQEIFVKDIFKPFVVRGQEVNSKEEVEHRFSILKPDYTTVKFEIYSSNKKSPLHVTDRGCTRLAQIVIDVEQTPEGEKLPELVCTMRFAATEITAQVTDLQTGRRQKLLLMYDDMGLKGAKGTKGTFLSVPLNSMSSSGANLDFITFDDGTSGFL